MECIAERRIEDARVPEVFCFPGRRHIGTGCTSPETPGPKISELSQSMDACGADNCHSPHKLFWQRCPRSGRAFTFEHTALHSSRRFCANRCRGRRGGQCAHFEFSHGHQKTSKRIITAALSISHAQTSVIVTKLP